jgi:hypothetical protein
MIQIGSGEPVPVLLDTGSAGLYVEDTAVGPAARPVNSAPITQQYVGSSVTARVISAMVQFDGVTGTRLQTAPVRIGAFPAHALPTGMAKIGAVGILGVAPGGNGSAQPSLSSPLAQLPRPLADGFTVDLAGGKVLLGPPALSRESIQLPLTQAGWHYPDGVPGWQKTVTLCWSIGRNHRCAQTSMDTGAHAGIASSSLIPNAPTTHGRISPSEPIQISTPSGNPLYSYTTSPGLSPRYLPLPVMNTGEHFFNTNTVGYNLDTGQAVLTPQPN